MIKNPKIFTICRFFSLPHYLLGFDGGLFPRSMPLGLPVVDGILPPSLKCVLPGFTVVFAIFGLLKKFLDILENIYCIMYNIRKEKTMRFFGQNLFWGNL